MDADALEEDGLAIQQDLLAARLNLTETDAVGDGAVIKRNLHLITFGILRTPQLGLSLHADCSRSISSSGEGLLDLQLRDREGHRVIGLRLVQLDAERDLTAFETGQLQVVILEIHR